MESEQSDKINIHCLTLNCGGQVPDSLDELLPLFKIYDSDITKKSFKPHIYIIGLQEIVALNAKNIFMKDKKKVTNWTKILNDALRELSKQEK
jgi:hypothetical protein